MAKVLISAISTLLTVLIGFAVVYDTTIDKCILEIEGVKYQEEDFGKYYRLVELEQDSTTEELNASDVYNQYVNVKIFLGEAQKYGITLTEDEKKDIEKKYESEDVDKNKLTELGISKEEYIRYYSEVMLASKFMQEAGTYYFMPEDDYLAYREQYSYGFKMYNYRILQVSAIPTSGDGEEKVVSNEDKQLARTKIEEALTKIKNGEDFEKIASEYGTYRIIVTADGYTLANGQLETMSLLYLNEAVTNLQLYAELININAGEYTSIIEDDDSYLFAKLESIEEGLDEASEARLKKDINTSYAQRAIISNTEVIRNRTKIKKVIGDKR